MQCFQQNLAVLNRVKPIAEGNRPACMHIIHFGKVLAFAVLGNGSNGKHIYRKVFAFLYNVFYLAFAVDGRFGVGHGKYPGIATGFCRFGAGFKGFFKFKPRVAKMAENIRKAGRNYEVGFFNNISCFCFNAGSNLYNPAVFNENICLFPVPC